MTQIKPHEVMKKGGKWLGGARTWLQDNIIRGDSLTWGSDEIIGITVKQFEEAASVIAAAAINEDRVKRCREQEREVPYVKKSYQVIVREMLAGRQEKLRSFDRNRSKVSRYFLTGEIDALQKFIKEAEINGKNCLHDGYNYRDHGRCCWHCGKTITDFGD